MIRRRIPALLLALCLAGNAQASDFSTSGVGTAGSEFLNIDVDPRGIAMGGAISAVTDDAYAMYWNPAGLTNIPRVSVSAMHMEYLADIRMQYLAWAQRFTDESVFGAAIRYMDAGEIDNTDINGFVIGQFRPKNYVLELSWAKSIADLTDSERDISLGITGRFFQSDFIAHAKGFSGDIGLQARYPDAIMPYYFGASLQNIGQGQKFESVRDTLPFRIRIGAAVKPKPFLLLVMEGVFPSSNHPYGAFGLEFAMDTSNQIKPFLRAGYNSRSQFNGLNGFRGASFGAGLKVNNFSFDYAFVPFGILGEAHRFSVNWNLPAKRSRRFRQR